MKVKIKKITEVEVKTLHVVAHVRYWEDAKVNGVEDEDGDLIPCRSGENWCPIIEVDTGAILNWKQGKTANIHYKVCDAGIYTLKDAEGNDVFTLEGYVPKMMSPKKSGYGDYIIMDVDENGKIDKWDFDPTITERE